MITPAASDALRLDLGCGPRKRPGFVGVDRVAAPGVDVVADLEQPLPFEDDAAIEVHCRSVLEHIADPIGLLDEIHRVLATGGRLSVFVPHFSNPYGHSDPTHRHLWGLYSLQYLSPHRLQVYKRKVPSHYTSRHWRTVRQRLFFRGESRFGNAALRAFGKAVNSSARWQERYERLGCWIVPCYAVSAELEPIKD